jgi:hypothetical protein
MVEEVAMKMYFLRDFFFFDFPILIISPMPHTPLPPLPERGENTDRAADVTS